jgi:hypothetical protein
MRMPTFLVVGAAKAGTTSLWRYLQSHPQVYMSPIKEPMFFACEGEEPDFSGPRPPWAVTDLEAYRTLFSAVTDEIAVGEASPQYLYSEKAPERIYRYLPDVKLMAIVRDPAERAFSHFLGQRRAGREPLSDFVRALDAEEERVSEGWGPSFHYVRRGLYYKQLSRYFELFGRERIKVYLYEDLETDPLGMMRDVFRFLGVDDTFAPGLGVRYNPSGVPRSESLRLFLSGLSRAKPYVEPLLPEGLRRRVLRAGVSLKKRTLVKPQLTPKIRGKVLEEYWDDVLRLQELIGRDLSSWLEP